MSGNPDIDVELVHVSTSYISAAMSEEEVLNLNYGKRLARHFLGLRQTPDYDDKILTFRKLRRYNIARMQHDLLKLYYHLKTEDGGTDDDRFKLSSLLRDHACAIRDWDYMAQNLTRFSRDSSLVQETRKLFPEIAWGDINSMEVAYFKPEEFDGQNRLNSILIWALPRAWTWTKGERETRPLSYRSDLEGKRGFRPRQASLSVQIIGSTIVALFSGACIIAPMVFMSIRPDHSKNLITVSVSVIVFGFFLAAVVHLRSKEIFLATATYAAVLVVFVGASGSSG